MNTIAIVPEKGPSNGATYRAVVGQSHAVGKTPGEALDTLTAQLGQQQGATLVLVQSLQPDQFFTAAQQLRLAELTDRWRTARAAGTALSPGEQTELEGLTAAELEAATQRAAALLRQLQP